MLVRNKPFEEWITVYYDPKSITEEKLLKLLRERRCKKSKPVRRENEQLTAMNPYASAGDIIKIRVGNPPKETAPQIILPEGWLIAGDKKGEQYPDGKTYLCIKVPEDAPQKKYNISLKTDTEKVINAEVEIVKAIGKPKKKTTKKTQ